ncbi:protein unzipped [Anoplophora glabripennis]|uniref:protein unzipped n=1 Tax=Anoplophora glabripennis TaxID=217634 RepID=UPI00087498A7|nr:protein unzipped [Anoplophora glabripennis]
MGELYYTFSLLLVLKVLSVKADHSVHILSENFEQYITSSTLQWVPSNEIDEKLLDSAVVAAYQSFEEPRENELEEESQDILVHTVDKPVYVCRARINSVWVSGQLRPKKSACVVSLYKKVSEYNQFEVLVSIEKSSRLSWVYKNKYTLISEGAVTSGENILKTYIARRSANSHNKDGSLTYNVGKFTPSENLGVFHLVDQNNNELQFEDGEILVETEPIAYELKSIKLERFRGRFPRTQKKLGEAVLKNEEDVLQHVASVISYKYNYSLFWGKGHGLLTGLPFTVTLPNGTHVKGQWAVPKEELKSEVAPVEKYLEAGTAVNVTLMGNYTESEIPYNATVVAIYKDGEKKEIEIRDTKREKIVSDVIALYDPVYFLHNNSHVPTTTTTTAATTSGTTSTTFKTSTPQEIASEIPTSHKTVDKNNKLSNHEDNHNILSDDQNVDRQNSSEKKPDVPAKPDGACSIGMFSSVTILAVSLVLLRVT